MPIPAILAYAVLGALGGAVTSKGTKSAREYLNKGETISAMCAHCGYEGPHDFSHIDRGNIAGAALGAAGGAIAGTVGGIIAKRVFACSGCNRHMYEDGSSLSWNADSAVKSAFTYQNVDDNTAKKMRELEKLLAAHKTQSTKDATRIAELESQVRILTEKSNISITEKALLEKAIKELMSILAQNKGAA